MIVYLALGSNLDEPEAHIHSVINEFEVSAWLHLRRVSSLYRSVPLESAIQQPDYINAVVEVETGLLPETLLAALQEIEQAHGRVRTGERWGPRPLDLDILLYGGRQIHSPNLQIPHPRMTERAFVLYPLHEIAAGLEIPGCGPLNDLLQNCPSEGLERLEDEQ